MLGQEPIDRQFMMSHVIEMLGPAVREERQLDGTVVMVGGDPGEVIVRIGKSILSVALFRVRWEGPHTPVVRPIRFATLKWRRIPASTLMMTLDSLIIAARGVRTATYRRCVRCEETKPPEWMHDQETCQSCAERYLGIVH